MDARLKDELQKLERPQKEFVYASGEDDSRTDSRTTVGFQGRLWIRWKYGGIANIHVAYPSMRI